MTVASKWSRPAREQRRLTAEERTFRAVAERDFQRQVTDLAELLGWTWCHWRPLRNGRGIWQVPVEGPLGKGWPDLTLLRVRDRRLIFAELKKEQGDLSLDQITVLEQLVVLAGDMFPEAPDVDIQPRSYLHGVVEGMSRVLTRAPRVEVHVWRPSDLADPVMDSVIGQVLR